MRFFNRLKRVLLEVDMFSSSNIITYNKEAHYKTMTGAIMSLMIICLIIMQFYNEIMPTLERTSIKSVLQVKKFCNPPEIKIVPLENNFMFGFSIKTFENNSVFDLGKGAQIFEIKAYNTEFSNGVLKNRQEISMVSCTRQHWKMMPYLVQNFEILGINKWKCPSLDTKLSIQGFLSSDCYKNMAIILAPCINSTSNNNNCASQQIIGETFMIHPNFNMKFSFVNPVINPTQANPTQYFLEDRNYAFISRTLGAEMYLQLSEYEINSDKSFLPYQDISTQRGFIAQEKATFSTFNVDRNNNILARLFITRSSNELIYTRKVMKISQVLSYLGGQISAITLLLFILKVYTQFSLEMSIGFDLFSEHPEDKANQSDTPNKEEQQQTKMTFGFFNFFMFYFYKFLKVFRQGKSFKVTQKMQKYYQEIRMQLDIKILLKRIIKLQSCMSHVLDQSDIQKIKDSQDVTYESARYLRNLLNKSNEEDEAFVKTIKQIKNQLTQKFCDQINQEKSDQENQYSEHVMDKFSPSESIIQKYHANKRHKSEELALKHRPICQGTQNASQQSQKDLIKKRGVNFLIMKRHEEQFKDIPSGILIERNNHM